MEQEAPNPKLFPPQLPTVPDVLFLEMCFLRYLWLLLEDPGSCIWKEWRQRSALELGSPWGSDEGGARQETALAGPASVSAHGGPPPQAWHRPGNREAGCLRTDQDQVAERRSAVFRQRSSP